MSPINRRTLLSGFAASGVMAFGQAPGAETPRLARRYWIDPRQAALPSRPWRKIHLDFHNSQYIPKIGERFRADEFGDRLVEANVDAIVVFAKDMHGYFYYPSAYGPVHPGLSFDLLGEQVAACRRRNIAVYAYYCTAWDNYLAEHHPEWLVMKRDRTSYLPKFDETPGWTALCLNHKDFIDLELKHVREFVSRYPLDGAWFDMPIPIAGECFCGECLRQLRAQGLDPFSTAVQRRHKQALHIAFLETLRETVLSARPGCQVDFNNQGVYGLPERVPYMDNIDIEALPTASWGYFYFPTITRYARTTGLTTYGMTGRFEASWADFGGLKLPVQLETELAGIVANAARCDIGDQMPPNGRLDPAVYHVIGKAYARIKALEPYLDGAVPVTEAALITAGLPLESPATEPNYGLVKLLIESRVQFDIVEPGVAWERYAMVVLGDDLEVDQALAVRLSDFMRKGGAVVISDRAGRNWTTGLGFHYEGASPFKPAFMIPKADFTGGIPTYEYALYEGASRWRAEAPATVVASLGEPLFQRSPEHYTSHAQSPFDHETPYAAVALSGSAALFGFPLGQSYFSRGYWVYRRVFQHTLKTLLPVQLIESNAPLSSEITLTRQKNRYLVHVVNFSALRRSPRHPDFYEDPIPLTEVRVRLNLPIKATAAKGAISGAKLTVRPLAAGGIEIEIPKVPIHEIAVLD